MSETRQQQPNISCDFELSAADLGPTNPSNKKMRLAELATVSKFERDLTLCVGVTANSVIRLFSTFFFVFTLTCTCH